MTQGKQHWRSLTDSRSDTFNAADLYQLTEGAPTTDLNVKIESAGGGSVKDYDTNKDSRKVMLRFVGVSKPLGLAAVNCRAMETITGSPFPRDWAGAIITLYVGKAERGRRKSDPEPDDPADLRKKIVVDAVRIRPRKVDANAPHYGKTVFDLEATIASFMAAESVEQLAAIRKSLRAPREHHGALAVAYKEAEDRIQERNGGAK